jgi:hypothetical protein
MVTVSGSTFSGNTATDGPHIYGPFKDAGGNIFVV